jgi:hypothetical protein
MNDKTLWIVGGLAVLGAAVGATVLIMQKKPTVIKEVSQGVSPTGAGGSSGVVIVPASANIAVTPKPPIVAPLQGTQNATANDLAALQAAEVAREQAAAMARAAKERADQIARMKFNLNNVENQQMLLLTQIKSIQTSEDNLNDFEQKAFNTMWEGITGGILRQQCKADLAKKYGGSMHGNMIAGSKQPACDEIIPSTSEKEDKNASYLIWRIARDPKADRGGYALLEKDRAIKRMPFEADLQRLEVQYQGLLNELKGIGETYQPIVPQAHK